MFYPVSLNITETLFSFAPQSLKTIIMEVNEISFENLPKAVAHLVCELAKIKALVEKG